jgi:hypothetical protein
MSEIAERHVGTLMEYCKDLFRFGRGLEAFRPLADELLKYMNESHAQRTQLTLAQEMARENERLKQRVKELEKVVSAVYDGVAWRVAPNSDGIHMVAAGQMHKWRTILSAAISPDQKSK